MTKISFGGVDLFEAFGILCETRRDVLAPPVNERNIHIPEKDGSWWSEEYRYNDRTVELGCVTMTELDRGMLRELAYVLSGKKKLVLSDEADKYYLAQLCDPSVIQHIGKKGTKHVLKFRCKPFAYGETVTAEIKNGVQRVCYKGTASAPVLIVLKNTGSSEATNILIQSTHKRP